MSDPRLLNKDWRMNHLWHIKNKNQQLVTFKPNRVQEHFRQNKALRNIILKSRQLGFTSYESVDMLDDVSFKKNLDAILIAQDLDTAKDIFSNKIDVAWSNFKLASLYKVNTESARQLKFDFGDGSISSITVDSSGRSGTFRRVHVTEFAIVCKKFPERAKEIIEGTIPAVPLDGRVDIESTADGGYGIFYDMFWEAWERGDPKLPIQFKAHFYNWTWDDSEIEKVTEGQVKEFTTSKDYKMFDDYQRKHELTDVQITYYYMKWLSLNRNWESLHKEYPTTAFEAFESSGNKLFTEKALSDLIVQPPIETAGDWKYYDEPIFSHRYALAADVGEGIGRDSSTCVIWDFTTLKPRVVATYRSNTIAPDIFAYEIKNGATKYSFAVVVPERNNHGHTTISKLREIYPENLIYKDDKDRLGWQTNLVSKPKMFYDLSTAGNNQLIDVPSRECVAEMRRYDKDQLRVRTYDEDTTEHFDLLTAMAIGFQMKDYMPNAEGGEMVSFVPDYDGEL